MDFGETNKRKRYLDKEYVAKKKILAEE